MGHGLAYSMDDRVSHLALLVQTENQYSVALAAVWKKASMRKKKQ